MSKMICPKCGEEIPYITSVTNSDDWLTEEEIKDVNESLHESTSKTFNNAKDAIKWLKDGKDFPSKEEIKKVKNLFYEMVLHKMGKRE